MIRMLIDMGWKYVIGFIIVVFLAAYFINIDVRIIKHTVDKCFNKKDTIYIIQK